MGININVPNQISQNTPLRTVRSGATAEPDNSVKYVPQTLTEEQQAQARENIGAAKAGEGGGATINEFHYLRDTSTDPATFYIDADGYEPQEGDLITIIWDWPFRTNESEEVAFKNPATLKNNSTNPSIYVKNAHQMETDYDEIDPEVNTRWTVRLEKVNDVWYAYNISTAVQADWTTVDTHAPSYIKNKPAISEDIIEDKNDVITIYSDKETNYTFNNGQMLDIWKNGVHTKLGNVGDNVRTVRLDIGKNILKFNGLFGTEFSDKSGHYTIVCPLSVSFNSLVWGTYTGYVNIFYTGSGWHMNSASGSTVFNMNNGCWQDMWTGSGNVVFVDKSMNNLNNGYSSNPTFLANYYVPKSRYNEFITKMETIFASSYIDVLKTKVIQYDFLTFDPNYTPNIVILPTLPLTMTDANNNTISGDFVAQNITIS